MSWQGGCMPLWHSGRVGQPQSGMCSCSLSGLGAAPGLVTRSAAALAASAPHLLVTLSVWTHCPARICFSLRPSQSAGCTSKLLPSHTGQCPHNE